MRVLVFTVCVAACSMPTDPITSTPLTSAHDKLESDLSVLVGPLGEDPRLVNSITSAHRSVHVLMYLLTDQGIQNALLDRHAAGLDVRVVLNKEVPNGVTNERSYRCLQSRGVPVTWAPDAFDYSHSKLIALDGQAAWIMTMNASTSSLQYNREFLAYTTNDAWVREAEALFEADYQHQPFVNAAPELIISPINSRSTITALIRSANQSLDIVAAALTDAKLAGELCDASARGVTVRAMTDGTTTNQQMRIFQKLIRCGVTVYTLDEPWVHAKAFVVDGERAYMGSINYTLTSLDYNREIGLVTDKPSAVATIAGTITADMAAGHQVSEPRDCATPSDCQGMDGAACINGFCQAYCLKQGQCQAGDVCVLGEQGWGTCQPEQPCGECTGGLVCKAVCTHCSADSECSGGLVCDTTRGYCKTPASDCTQDASVCKGSRPVCDVANKKCVACGDTPELACADDKRCDSDFCSKTYGQCL